MAVVVVRCSSSLLGSELDMPRPDFGLQSRDIIKFLRLGVIY